jgi:hypothetical protein
MRMHSALCFKLELFEPTAEGFEFAVEFRAIQFNPSFKLTVPVTPSQAVSR